MSSSDSFRGIQGIREIKERIAPLVNFYLGANKVATVTCRRVDFDLIQRWPKAAAVEGFDVTHNGVFYKGLKLGYDRGPSRYGDGA